jgi:hypothetical protein
MLKRKPCGDHRQVRISDRNLQCLGTVSFLRKHIPGTESTTPYSNKTKIKDNLILYSVPFVKDIKKLGSL